MLKLFFALSALSPLALLAPSAAPVPQLPCPTLERGDVNGDGRADIVDLVVFSSELGMQNRLADLNFDFDYDIADWVVMFDVYETQGRITISNQKSAVDANLDGQVDISDVVTQALRVFRDGSTIGNVTRDHAVPPQGDANTDIADFIVHLDWFLNGCR